MPKRDWQRRCLLLVLDCRGAGGGHLMLGAKPAVRISLGTAFWVLARAPHSRLSMRCSGSARAPRHSYLRWSRSLPASPGWPSPAPSRGVDRARICHPPAALCRCAFAPYRARRRIGRAGHRDRVSARGCGRRNTRLQGPLFVVLNVLQTIPSIALFGLLIVPLAALATAVPALAAIGVGGIGVAPAIVALVLYALFPVVRNTAAGLAGVDAAVIEAGRGMGLTPRQIFRQVELPLALPVLLAGLRIVTVQAIGLAVVAALIGAGGLGTFVFEGLGQYAVDLVLLGALPAIFLALAADFILQTLAAVLRSRPAP